MSEATSQDADGLVSVLERARFSGSDPLGRDGRDPVARRGQAVLEAIERRGGYGVVPAPVLAEASRTRSRRDATARVIRRLDVVPTARRIAEMAGALLEAAALSSKDAIDAFVVATAAMHQSALVLTGDAGDLERLAAALPNVAILRLE